MKAIKARNKNNKENENGKIDVAEERRKKMKSGNHTIISRKLKKSVPRGEKNK